MRLIRESEWATIFEMDSGVMLTRSRFLEDEFAVPARRIIVSWKLMSEKSQIEFLRAFHVRPNLHEEDERILDFLMGVDDPKVWIMISLLMPKYRDRNRALEFLLETVKGNSEALANCYHALGSMDDSRAVPVLRAKFNGYSAQFDREGIHMATAILIDYAYCCAALRRLEPQKHEEYTAALRALSHVPDRRVTAQTARILESLGG